MRWTYLCHKYQVYNDQYQWKYILQKKQYGDIFHFDFSENITQMLKQEPQSSHFNKDQFTLHCAVRYCMDDSVKYEYHFSNDTKHDSATVSLLTHELVNSYLPEIVG